MSKEVVLKEGAATFLLVASHLTRLVKVLATAAAVELGYTLTNGFVGGPRRY
jgi:hypothetical protein